MVSKFLLPHRYKIIGWILLVPSFIMGVLWVAGYRIEIYLPVFAIWADPDELFKVITKDIYNEIVSIPLLISLMMVSFAKEKNEDEYITKLRLDSLVWSIYINYSFLFLSILFVYSGGFYNIMIYNMFTLLILFICKFYFVLYQNKVQIGND